MNYTVKSMILKEVKEITQFKNYYQTLAIYIVLGVGLTLFLCYAYSMEDISLKGAMATNLIFLPVFFMFIFIIPFVKEKFNDEKIMNHFEAILATPVSLKEIWLSKLISIFLLSYPVVLLSICIFTPTCYIITKINPISFPPLLWLLALFIAPILPMMYVALSSWTILRFTHPRLLEIINLIVMGILIIVPLSAGQIATSQISENLLTSINITNIIGITITGISIFFAIIYFMIKNIDKEKITI